MRNNLGYKLLALLIAIVIWTYVNEFEFNRDSQNGANPYITKRLEVPLQVRKVDSGHVVVSAPKSVTVVVRGRRDDVLAVKSAKDDVAAFASLNGYSSGTHLVPVVVRLPEEFIGSIEKQADPSAVNVTLEAKVRKEMPIEARFSDTPPDGYVFGDPIVSPGNASITGAGRTVDSVKRLAVLVDSGSIGSDGITGSFNIFALDAVGRRVQGVEIDPERAHLRLELLEMPHRRTVFVSPETEGLPPAPFHVEKIDVQPNTLVVSGSASDLSRLTTVQTEPVILTDRKQTFTQRVRAILPSGVRVQRDRYVTVTVEMGQSPSTGETP